MAGAQQREHPERENLGAISRLRLVPTPMLRLGSGAGDGVGDGADVAVIVDALRAGAWSASSRFVKQDGARWVWLGGLSTDRGEVGLVIKGRARSGLGLMPDRHAIKQAIGAARLRAVGVATSEPIALLDVQLESGGAERWFVLRSLPGETLAQRLARGLSQDGRWFGEEAELARRVGALVCTLCESGLFNRDHKASNLIVMETGEVGVVDTVAVRRRRGASARRRMLLAMCKELSGIGAMPRRGLLMRCLRAASGGAARSDWRAIDAMLRGAGDTTPRVDPLDSA